MRDPRAVSHSRSQSEGFSSQFSFHHSSHTSFDSKQSFLPQKTFDFVREAAIFCDTMYTDMAKRELLNEQFPGRIKAVVFEEFVIDPLQSAADVYRFLGLNLPGSVEHWLEGNTIGSEAVATKWKYHLDTTIAKEIKSHEKCRPLYEKMSAVWM